MVLWFILLVLFCFSNVSGSDPLVDDFNEINSHLYFSNKIMENLDTISLDISKGCRVQGYYYAQALLARPKKLWAHKMFDSGAKIPSGIYEGNFVDLGFFQECIDIVDIKEKSERISGKYCIGTIPFTRNSSSYSLEALETSRNVIGDMFPDLSLGIQYAVCFPAACSAEDIETLYRKLFIPLKFKNSLCQTKASQPVMDRNDFIMISFFALMLLLMVSSTTYEVVLYYTKKEPINGILLAFSVLTNGRNLLKTSSEKGQIYCLNGIRVISMMWIILGHKYNIHVLLPIKNYFYLIQFTNEPANMFLLGSFVSVDTFFLLGGIVMSYVFMMSQDKGIRFNILPYYIHRYLRLTPIVAVIMCLYLTLVKHLGSGPLWPSFVNSLLVGPCGDWWWKLLLYLQNMPWISVETCILQSWYLSVDFQLFLLSPIFLIPLTKWPMKAIGFIGFAVACSTVGAFVSALILEIRPSWFTITSFEEYFNFLTYYYAATWIRCTPWLIGLIVGYLIYSTKQTKGKLRLNKGLLLLLWVISLAVMILCVFGGHDLIVKRYKKLASAFHIALVRPAWSIALSWVIFACVLGYGGPINWFLSLPIFQIVSRLTYAMYMIHVLVIVVANAQLTSPAMFGHFQIMYSFWSDFIIILVVSAIFTLAFESPIIAIEKSLHRFFSERRSPKPFELR